MTETTMLRVNSELIREAKKKFPELEGLNDTALIDVLLRFAIKPQSIIELRKRIEK